MLKTIPCRRCLWMLFAFLGLWGAATWADEPGTTGPLSLAKPETPGAFLLADAGQAAPIVVDAKDAEVVRIAAKAFAEDVRLITQRQPEIQVSPNQLPTRPILFGTLGASGAIDRLAADGKIPAAAIRGRWECFLLAIVDNPEPGLPRALVVAGSDPRGTAFGIFELSRRLGVSPWVWWADVLPEPRASLAVAGTPYASHEPSVRYRGIFLNDEDFGLKPWAAATQDPEIKDIGPNTYARIFELLLRLKANLIWPAMHECTKAFCHYPGNLEAARRYAIVVGSSHCEPMLRNNVYEWKHGFKDEYSKEPGPWNFKKNRDDILRYWSDRVRQTQGNDIVFTLGMRGIHDSGIEGYDNLADRVAAMNQILGLQREILAKTRNRPATEIPQIFCPYKEVLELYQNGVIPPEDVTLLWADDNIGYVRQLSTTAEQARSGRSGVYYHLSYWGSGNQSYLWFSSISPALVSYEMNKSYAYGADRLWVVNVGDIKPAELETAYFLDLAYDVGRHPPQAAMAWVRQWAADTFGTEHAEEVAAIKREYYRLCQSVKPEHLESAAWSPEETRNRLQAWEALMQRALALEVRMPERLADAYFELVLYPTLGAGLMNRKFLLADASLAAPEGSDEAKTAAVQAKQAYQGLQDLANHYNRQAAHGKWAGMMSWTSKYPNEAMRMPRAAGDPPPAKKSGWKKLPLSLPSLLELTASKPTAWIPGKAGRLEIFDGLGFSDSGIAAMPFDMPAADPAKAPGAIYKIDLPPGTYEIAVRSLPTRRLNSERPALRYAIQLDDAPAQIVDAKTEDAKNSHALATNAIRGYQETTTIHEVKTRPATLTLRILDPGLEINQLVIRKPGAKPSGPRTE